jgi:hypothetical protein
MRLLAERLECVRFSAAFDSTLPGRSQIRHIESAMKLPRRSLVAAFTVIDALVCIALLGFVILGLLYFSSINVGPAAANARRIACLNNLKQVGLAYRVWANDNGDLYPAQVSVTNGGAREWVAAGDFVSVFQVMSNELATPRILVCPEDTSGKGMAPNFPSLNTNSVSYFVGLDVASNTPTAFLSGDHGLTNGLPVTRGILQVTTNRPVAWSRNVHIKASPVILNISFGKLNRGNIALGDGSAESFDNGGPAMRAALYSSGLATNRIAMP